MRLLILRNVTTLGDAMGAGPVDTGPPTDVAGRILVRDVVRTVVAAVAAEELPVLEALVQFDDDTVVRRLRGRGRRREPLGFGWVEIANLATPVVWLVVDQAVRQLGKQLGTGATSGFKALLRKVFRRRSAPVSVPPLTPEQLADVRERVLTTAVQRGLGKKRAEELADAVYTTLSLTTLAKSSPAESTVESQDSDSPQGQG